MPDVFSRKKRSEVMANIRSRGNKATELKLASIFRRHGITGWRRQWPLPGKPDFVFPKARLAVFVDGCFWHGCPMHGRNPGTNRGYWLPKLRRNQERDKRVTGLLSRLGWRVVRLWEHTLAAESHVVARVTTALRAACAKPIKRQQL